MLENGFRILIFGIREARRNGPCGRLSFLFSRFFSITCL